ncbi:MAG: DUF2070 family protein [Crenarchaeota archaeon]|nr:DUF2070 family protein [Thermoproteota archaeon]
MAGDSRAFQYYTLFSYFPRSAKGLVAAYATVLAVYSAIAFATSFSPMVPALYAAIGIVYIAATRLAVPYFDTKKSVGLAAASITLGLPAEVVCDAFGMYGVSFASLPFLTTLVARGILRSAKRFVVCVAVAAFTQLAFYAIHICSLAGLAIREALVGGSTLAALLILGKLQRTNIGNGVDVLALANAWAKFILVRDPSELESVFDRCGVEREVVARALVLNSASGKRIAVVVPGIHFGPFRELGSSPFPHMLDDELRKRGIEPIVLHGAGSHELDIVTSSESARVAREIASRLASEPGEPAEMFEPFRVSDDKREALVVPSNKLYLIAISSPVTGGDDLPHEVQPLAEKIASEYLGVDVAVVDCHNLEGPRELRVEPFLKLLREALSRMSRQCSEVRASIAVEEVRGHVRGLCSPRVKVVGLGCDDKSLGIVYLFGNNADVGVRERLRRVLIEAGFDDAEVITADDHLCTATTFDAPYYAVSVSQPLLEAVSRAARKAFKGLERASLRYLRIALKTKILGDNAFKLLRVAEGVGDVMLSGIKAWTILFNVVGFAYAILRAVHLL